MSYDDLGPVGDQMFSIGDDGEKWAAMNRGVTPIFFIEPVLNPSRSEKEGCQKFDEEERVRIVVAGDPLNQIVHPVDDLIRQRFAPQYREWKERRTERHIDGTPLRMWPPISPGLVAEFEALSIFNVEGLANIADTNIGRSMSLRPWREKAQNWLALAKDGAVTLRLTEENRQLRADMEDMRRQIAELGAVRREQAADRDEAEGEPRRGPGRPRRDAAA